MLDEGFEAALLEPGPVGALNAKTIRHIPEVMCTTLEDAGFHPGSLSAMACFDVLEHVADDRSFIGHAHAALQPNGMLYATVPASPCLWSLSDVTAGHFRRYSKARVFDLFGGRFEVLFATYFFRALTLPVFLLRTVPYRLGLARRKNLLAAESEHGIRDSPVLGTISKSFAREAERIANAERISVGTSFLCVARKRTDRTALSG
jgi:hypothetical protein